MSVRHQVVRKSDSDVVTVIGAGVTLHEALSAANMLASEGKLTLPPCGKTSILSLRSLVPFVSSSVIRGLESFGQLVSDQINASIVTLS